MLIKHHLLSISALWHYICTALSLQAPLSISNQVETVQNQALDDDVFARPSNTLPTLFDVLLLERSSTIFFDYLREVPALSQRVSDPEARTTILLPTNKAVLALGWKPERGPPSNSGEVRGGVITEEALQGNVEKWVSAHLLPRADLTFDGDEALETLLADKTIKFEKIAFQDTAWKDYVIRQGNVSVQLHRRVEASNGVVYLIDGTISLD